MTIISKDIPQLQSLGSYAFAVKVSRDEDGIAGHPNSIENPNWSVRQGTPMFCKGGGSSRSLLYFAGQGLYR